jgi:hypothetical protein
METIKEKAQKYAYELESKCTGSNCGFACTGEFCNKDIGHAYIAAAKDVQRWNNATEVKPRPMEWVLVKFDVDIPPAVGRYTDDGYWNFPYYDGNDAIVAYWRYIELK